MTDTDLTDPHGEAEALRADRDTLVEARDMLGRLWEKEKLRADQAEARERMLLDNSEEARQFLRQRDALRAEVEHLRAALRELADDPRDYGVAAGDGWAFYTDSVNFARAALKWNSHD